jgi:hypothetical protein
MWSTFIPVAIAGAIVASLVNVASELNKVRSSHLALDREAGLVQQSTQLKNLKPNG